MLTRRILPAIAVALVLGSCVPQKAPRPLPEQPPMVRVPGGTYVVGYDYGPENERPAHVVRVAPFEIDQYEVTNRMFLVFCRATNHPFPRHWLPDSTVVGRSDRLPFNEIEADLPVVWVTWHDASAYAEWRGCRLPTEVEWEVAARCTTAYLWPWGGLPDTTGGKAPSGRPPANIAGAEDGYAVDPAPVGSFPNGRSCWGAYDLAGNVAEWVGDWYLPAAWQRQSALGTLVTTDSLYAQRTIRGGSWFDPVESVRATTRAGFDPDYASDTIGFRCARDAGRRDDR